MPNRILIVGNLGYVGPVVARHFRETMPDAELIGFDAGYFSARLLDTARPPDVDLDRQYFGDIRAFDPTILDGVDAVIQLAALSNDPLGKFFEALTPNINFGGVQTVAEAAKAHGVRRFVFASSCSVYGAGGDAPKMEHDSLAPQTAYARSKIDAENMLARLASPSFLVTNLRFATAGGFSPRLRLDLVLNDFVAAALVTERIEILSNGRPLRPLIHVEDMARAMRWGIERSLDNAGPLVTVNTGADANNFMIADLADAVANELGDVSVSVNHAAPEDQRSYRVDFSTFARLAPDHQPRFGLTEMVNDLAENLRRLGFADPDFRRGGLIRLNALKMLVDEGVLTPDLRWTRSVGSLGAETT